MQNMQEEQWKAEDVYQPHEAQTSSRAAGFKTVFFVCVCFALWLTIHLGDTHQTQVMPATSSPLS